MECALITNVSDLNNDDDALHRSSCVAMLWLARGLAVLLLGIATYLLWASFAGGNEVAGCGGTTDFGCGHVLTSRWSRWLGLPVALPGTILYALTLLALFRVRVLADRWDQRIAWQLLLVLATTFIGAAAWFLALQFLVLESLCGYCVTAHGCGLLLAGFISWYSPVRWRQSAVRQTGPGIEIQPTAALASILLGFVGSALLIAGQLLVAPGPLDMQVRTITGPAGDSIILDLNEHPRLGPTQAKYVIIELYDYTCPHCRATEGYLKEARQRYGDQLAILPLVVPLHPLCNRYIEVLNPGNEHACEYARLALAVWRVKSSEFEGFHNWLIESAPTLEVAQQHAAELVGADVLADALAGDGLNQQLEKHIRIYAQFGGGRLPRLIHGAQTTLGQPANARQLFDFLEKDVGLRPPSESP